MSGGGGCPGCDQIDSVEQTSSTALVAAWRCTRCGMSWAVSVAAPRPAYLTDHGAAVEQIGSLRWKLAQVIALADEAPQLTDDQLRDRVATLASSTPQEDNDGLVPPIPR